MRFQFVAAPGNNSLSKFHLALSKLSDYSGRGP